MHKSLYSLMIAGLIVIAPASANVFTNAQLSPSSVSKLTKNELYFGLLKPAGSRISEVEWQQFVNTVITPRFREGLTVVDAYGQYQNKSGRVIRERTKLVILIHDHSASKNKMIQEIIVSYKQKFQQESVLQVTSDVRVSF